jgi:hypothetical protein
LSDSSDSCIRFSAHRPKASYDSTVVSSEFLQGDERFLVGHLGKRVSAPKTDFPVCIIEILAKNAMRFRPMVMREGFRSLPSDFGMFSLISNGSLKRLNHGFSVR